jgi:PHD/YefM family antitoxin component YafN of YafNO toxin-antitoxin module
MTLHPQYLTDKAGNKSAVLLPIKEYEQLLEELEELEDIRLYDEAKKEDDGTRISFDDYLKQRKAKHA